VDQRGSLEAIEIRKFSLPCSQSKPPFLYQPAIPSATTLSQSAHTISKHQERSKIVLLRIIKFYMTITEPFLSYGSLVQTLTENGKKEKHLHRQQ